MVTARLRSLGDISIDVAESSFVIPTSRSVPFSRCSHLLQTKASGSVGMTISPCKQVL